MKKFSQTKINNIKKNLLNKLKILKNKFYTTNNKYRLEISNI